MMLVYEAITDSGVRIVLFAALILLVMLGWWCFRQQSQS
jgi:hypothetical protein